ncbi:ATP-binding cassette domain-containing protein [Thermobacillus composti]|uniref:ATP-binding cassette domain-containing protein n=1 Tax=Thermobacillus composti TaxID=377615 RepID=UPI000A03AC88|nr:ATP-binding cassette domain-containing protein [Thermobacillus composti]
MNRIIDAAKAVNAHHFICQLPNGYNTVLDRNGSNLSGGQKQRIALARALFTDRPIILMDEPTANLDQKTEHKIIKDTEKAFSDKILIIVVHDYSWIRPFDKVLFMHEGYILENATDSELRSKYGDYYRMLERTREVSL